MKLLFGWIVLRTLQLSSSLLSIFWRFERHKQNPIWFHYIQEKADTSTVDLSKNE